MCSCVDDGCCLVLRQIQDQRTCHDLQQSVIHYRRLDVSGEILQVAAHANREDRVGFAKNLNVRYGGVFIGVIGICANVPTNFAYQHNNTVGQSKRALCLAMMTMGGAFGGIISGNIFQEKWAPTYAPSLVICICFQVSFFQ